jgi:hypothetical protein
MNAGVLKLAFMNATRILKLALTVAIVFALLDRIRAVIHRFSSASRVSSEPRRLSIRLQKSRRLHRPR